MRMKNIYQNICQKAAAGTPLLAILTDPDKGDMQHFAQTARLCQDNQVDYILTGGSLLTQHKLDACIETLKANSQVPVVLFPGNNMQISPLADGILLLSLISGRNPDMLIGQHVVAAPLLRQSQLEIIPTGYMLVDGGNLTSVLYMSNTQPIPRNKPDIAVCTAMAGEMLGLKLIYLEAGSGAHQHIDIEMVKAVKASINIPLIVGGGIRTAQQAHDLWAAGADMLVVGNATETNPGLIGQLAQARMK